MTTEPQRYIGRPYLFCPYDGVRLVRKRTEHAGDVPTCPKCGFVNYDNPKPCVAVLVERDGRILLVRRGVEPAKGMWDIPGGFIDCDESAEEAARREILEETGLRLTNIRYVASVADIYGRRDVPTLNLCFAAEVAGGDPKPQSDVVELGWFGPDELPQQLAFRHQEGLLLLWRQRCHGHDARQDAPHH